MPWAPSHAALSVWRTGAVCEAQSEPHSGSAFGRDSPQTKNPTWLGRWVLLGRARLSRICQPSHHPHSVHAPRPGPCHLWYCVHLPARPEEPVVMLGMEVWS